MSNNSLKIEYKIYKKGDGTVNQDAYGCIDNFAFVIDGATDVFNKNILKKKDDVKWYVGYLKHKLIQNYDNNRTLKSILKDTINEIYIKINKKIKIDNISEYYLPTFSISMIRNNKNCIEYFILGDVSIGYVKNKKPVLLYDTRISKFSDLNRKRIKKNQSNKKKIYQETRKYANTINGYPIGSVSGKGIDRGIEGRIKVDDNILLFSDGILDYIKEDLNTLLDLLKPENKRQCLKKINIFYNDKNQYASSGRPKLNDDKTVLLLKL